MTKALTLVAVAWFLPWLATGCVIEDRARPRFSSNVQVASHYIHRGMVENERGVLQADVNTDLDVKKGGVLGLNAWANMDLSDKTGDAWFPDGHGGKFTEIDLTAQYTQTVAHFDLTGGVQSYNLPDGLEFENGERGATTEVFARVGREVLGFYPAAELRVDRDEADGYYADFSLRRAIPIVGKLRAEVGGVLGYSDADESFWTYGLPEGGLTDLSGTATLFYDADEHTTLKLVLGGSTILDSKLREWFDLIGIEKDNLWIGVGVSFSY